MSLFIIRNGQLMPANPSHTSVQDVVKECGYVTAFVGEGPPYAVPLNEEEVVVVADAIQQLHCVREGVVVSSAYADNDPCELLLFRVTNEDEGGEVQIVAISVKNVTKSDGWKIIGQENWVRVGPENALVRSFPSVEEAQAALVDNRFVFLTTDEVAGWTGIVVHGYMQVEPITAEHPKVVEMLGIPKEWMALEGSFRKLKNVIDDEQSSFEKSAKIVRVIMTDAGIFLVVMQNDGMNGIKYFGREFAREEANNCNMRL